jgi:hypothetical protein
MCVYIWRFSAKQRIKALQLNRSSIESKQKNKYKYLAGEYTTEREREGGRERERETCEDICGLIKEIILLFSYRLLFVSYLHTFNRLNNNKQ